MELEARYREAGRIEVVAAETRVPAAGQARVRIERCGICGSDLHVFRGHSALPTVCPGHEMSGIVDGVGSEVAGVREGDRVAVEPLLRCGTCRRCRAGDYHLCGRLSLCGVTAPGGMASHVVVPAYTLFALPAAVDFELGALAEPTAVAVHAARLGGVAKGSRVLVLGAGTIGLVAVAAARHLGASFVAVTARHPHQRALATALGADQVLDPADLTPLAEKPDAVLETVGGQATTVADGVLAVARGGTVVMIGLFEKAPVFDPMAMIVKEVRLVGSMVYNTPTRSAADFDVALEVLAERADAMPALVTHTFPLVEAQRGFATAADKTSGAVKVMLAPQAG